MVSMENQMLRYSVWMQQKLVWKTIKSENGWVHVKQDGDAMGKALVAIGAMQLRVKTL